MDYYAEALVQFERRTWREDGRAYYLARLEKRLFELSRDLTIADWKAIRNEHYWSDKAWVQTRSWPTIEKEIAISKIWTYPSGNPQVRRYRWTQMVSNTCTGATDWQSSSLMQGKSARAYFSPMGSASGAKREYAGWFWWHQSSAAITKIKQK